MVVVAGGGGGRLEAVCAGCMLGGFKGSWEHGTQRTEVEHQNGPRGGVRGKVVLR